jgi:hypothetical protein
VFTLVKQVRDFFTVQVGRGGCTFSGNIGDETKRSKAGIKRETPVIIIPA